MGLTGREVANAIGLSIGYCHSIFVIGPWQRMLKF